MKKRRSHILEGNKGNARPQHVIFFDTETKLVPLSSDESKHVLILGWACYHRPQELGKARKPQWFQFTTSGEFWAFVDRHCKNDKRLYLVAHNVAFDLRIVGGFSYLRQNGWEEKFTYDKGLVTILRFTREKQSLEILSTTNFFGMKLKDLGKLVGLEKRDIEFGFADLTELSFYCKRDVEIILKAWGLWIRFLDDHNLGTFKRTISSQAFAAYRHRFMDIPITIHGNMKVCQFEREAYRGGRTECFRVGEFPKEPYYYVDVNGMYAHQMVTQAYPYKLVGHIGTLPVRALKNKLRHFAVIARVVIETEEPAFVFRHNKRNVYPVGTFESVLTTPDLKYALEQGMVKEVKEVTWYQQEHIFRTYTQYFTALKQQYEREGNTAFRGMAKLLVNALYGKFGQTGDKPKQGLSLAIEQSKEKTVVDHLLGLVGKNRRRNVHVNMGIIDRDTGRWEKPPDFQNQQPKSGEVQESYNSFPAIVAHVTAYARHYLWLLILKAGRENTFYCDTDSLIVNQQGLDNLRSLLHPTKPGHLKIEKQGDNLRIFAPKDYTISDRTRQKGIRSNAIEIGEATYRQEQWLGLAGAIRRGEHDLVTIKQVVKTLKREIKTGVVQSDGWITPLRFPL